MGQEPANGTLGYYFFKILDRYTDAKQSLAFGGQHEIYQYFDGLRRLLEATPPVRSRPYLRVVASYGRGNWANIPWVSLLDSRETTSTQRGTYAVYLFQQGGSGVYFNLAQGVTEHSNERGAGAADSLAAQGSVIRAGVTDLAAHGFDLSGKTDLATSGKLGRLYEASTIAAKYYEKSDIPTDASLIDDLEHMLVAYERVVVSGATRSMEPQEPLALIGTWGTIKADIDSVAEQIRERGAWASPWSFKLKDEAYARLRNPFDLYINGGGGQIVARARVTAVARAPTPNGMTTPWPEITSPDLRTSARFGPGSHEAIKTWFKISSIEFVPPFRASELKLAHGLSTPENLLNQNAFGYVYERSDLANEPDVAADGDNGSSSGLPPPDFDWLVEATLLAPSVLEDMASSLSSSAPQIVLAGPPGTSKTWVAQKLAEFVTAGRSEAIRTVQFHPSYTYESFMEGLRPRAGTGGISFELVPGAVLELVDAMRKANHLNDPKHPYVLILDEANRANLPRVLGELLFLFEYRNKSIRLQYSGEFKLPTNLYFIATMNTADRSIRSIDAALRRRFDVYELSPDSGVLARYFEREELDFASVVDGMVSLNASLKNDIDRHHTIGHSFFMSTNLSPALLRKIWERRIYPLIEEYFFDQPDLASDYTFQRFWPDAT